MRNKILFLFIFLFIISCRKDTTGIENEDPLPPGYQQDIPWPSLADSPWPMHHGDPQSTGRSKYAGPQEGVIDWKIDTLYTRSAVSIGLDSIIYFSSSYSPSQGLYAVYPSGDLKWKIPEIASTLNSTTPLISADSIIYVASAAAVVAINSNGTFKWIYSSDNRIRSIGTNIGLDGIFYFISDNNNIVALSPTGQLKWELNDSRISHYLTSGISFSPDGSTIYASGLDVSVVAINILSQEIEWTFGEISLYCTPLIDSNGYIYVLSKIDSINEGKPSLFSIYPDGNIRWSYVHNNPLFRDFPSYLEGTIDKYGNYYFAFDSLYSVAYDGKLNWKIPLDGNATSALVCDKNNIIYVIVELDGAMQKIIAVDSEGNIIWELNTPNHPFTGYSPALGKNERLYVPTFRDSDFYTIK